MRPNPHFLRTLVVGVPLLLGLHEARAQTPDSIEIREMLQRAQNRNWYVRIQHASDTVQGRVRLIRDTVATIGQIPVRIQSVQSLERRDRKGSLQSASGIAGGLLVASFVFVVGAAYCESQCHLVTTMAKGFVMGGVVGGLLGYAIEPGSHVWIPVWPDK